MYHPLLERAELDYPLGGGTKVYRKLIEATDRLLKGEFEHPDLLGKRDTMSATGEEDPRLPVNVENVVIEAGVDRKALVGKAPRYPKLATFLKRGIKPTHGVAETTTRLIERLQSETREWKNREQVLRSKLAASIIEIEKLRRDKVELEGRLKRVTSNSR